MLSYTCQICVYGEIGWKKGLLTVGAKEQPMELRDQELSSGAQTLGINARPVPGVRIELKDYWDVPGLSHWLGFKGHIFYGKTTDDIYRGTIIEISIVQNFCGAKVQQKI